MRRRHRDQPRDPLIPVVPDAIAVAISEVVTLIEIFDHAHARMVDSGEVDKETLANASGSALVPMLYARAGCSSLQGRSSIPLLTDEIGLLEAAVINLESYQGNEVVLCAGYQLLEDFANRKRNTSPVCHVHGILAFTGEAEGTTSGSVAPSMA
ncbi:hypothetical protein OG241_14885 [Streptomyces sp. NBC_01390]|uniref:hypothetical protein n=1 Tax=Streptomyces sp. NBC_01390 TaxID=2903850 RepID=UPI003244FDB8